MGKVRLVDHTRSVEIDTPAVMDSGYTPAVAILDYSVSGNNWETTFVRSGVSKVIHGRYVHLDNHNDPVIEYARLGDGEVLGGLVDISPSGTTFNLLLQGTYGTVGIYTKLSSIVKYPSWGLHDVGFTTFSLLDNQTIKAFRPCGYTYHTERGFKTDVDLSKINLFNVFGGVDNDVDKLYLGIDESSAQPVLYFKQHGSVDRILPINAKIEHGTVCDALYRNGYIYLLHNAVEGKVYMTTIDVRMSVMVFMSSIWSESELSATVQELMDSDHVVVSDSLTL